MAVLSNVMISLTKFFCFHSTKRVNSPSKELSGNRNKIDCAVRCQHMIKFCIILRTGCVVPRKLRMYSRFLERNELPQ